MLMMGSNFLNKYNVKSKKSGQKDFHLFWNVCDRDIDTEHRGGGLERDFVFIFESFEFEALLDHPGGCVS